MLPDKMTGRSLLLLGWFHILNQTGSVLKSTTDAGTRCSLSFTGTAIDIPDFCNLKNIRNLQEVSLPV